MRGDVRVRQLLRLIHRLADDHLRGERAAGDGRPTAKGLELRILDYAILNFYL